MREGKNIHFSPVDNKPLCSYSKKICRQRRLNGYAFCIRHILEDESAPFKQCSYVTKNSRQKCLNAIPSDQDRGYCHSHMQVAGIIPKTERKTKPANGAASNGSKAKNENKSNNDAKATLNASRNLQTEVNGSDLKGTSNGKASSKTAGEVNGKVKSASSTKKRKNGKVSNCVEENSMGSCSGKGSESSNSESSKNTKDGLKLDGEFPSLEKIKCFQQLRELLRSENSKESDNNNLTHGTLLLADSKSKNFSLSSTIVDSKNLIEISCVKNEKQTSSKSLLAQLGSSTSCATTRPQESRAPLGSQEDHFSRERFLSQMRKIMKGHHERVLSKPKEDRSCEIFRNTLLKCAKSDESLSAEILVRNIPKYQSIETMEKSKSYELIIDKLSMAKRVGSDSSCNDFFVSPKSSAQKTHSLSNFVNGFHQSKICTTKSHNKKRTNAKSNKCDNSVATLKNGSQALEREATVKVKHENLVMEKSTKMKSSVVRSDSNSLDFTIGEDVKPDIKLFGSNENGFKKLKFSSSSDTDSSSSTSFAHSSLIFDAIKGNDSSKQKEDIKPLIPLRSNSQPSAPTPSNSELDLDPQVSNGTIDDLDPQSFTDNVNEIFVANPNLNKMLCQGYLEGNSPGFMNQVSSYETMLNSVHSDSATTNDGSFDSPIDPSCGSQQDNDLISDDLSKTISMIDDADGSFLDDQEFLADLDLASNFEDGDYASLLSMSNVFPSQNGSISVSNQF